MRASASSVLLAFVPLRPTGRRVLSVRASLGVDVGPARADTPSTSRWAHLNAAGSSPPPASVLRAQISHLELEAELGGYAAAQAVAEAERNVYSSCARLLNAASPGEIALLDSSASAFAKAIYSVPLQPGDIMLSLNDAEYAANAVAMLQHAKRCGAQALTIRSTPDGGVDLPLLARLLQRNGKSGGSLGGRGRIRAVCLTHVPSNGGVVADAAAVGEVLRRYAGTPEEGGPLYLLDACQSVGQLAVDVRAIGCDFAAATGRKWLRAPRGTALLYARAALTAAGSDLLAEPPILDHAAAEWLPPVPRLPLGDGGGGALNSGGGAAAGAEGMGSGLGGLAYGLGGYAVRNDAQRFQLWEGAVAGRLGLGAAAEYALRLGLHNIEASVRGRAAQLREGAAGVKGVRVADLSGQCEGALGLSGIVALDVEAIGGAAVILIIILVI
ncbi:pyridoxal phosphate-dependent transferase [Pavlovales sp. CCMP2436]|nr:pyridoxal phosphate-dependent transferase [Pavlovales sp. CCMP2436]